MAGVKQCSTGVMANIFAYLYSNASTMRIMVVTSSSPLNIAGTSSNSADCLAISTNAAYPTTGHFVVADAGNNLQCTIGACSCDTVLRNGQAACVIIVNISCSEVMYVTTCTTQDLTAGSKVNIGSWVITVNQPT